MCGQTLRNTRFLWETCPFFNFSNWTLNEPNRLGLRARPWGKIFSLFMDSLSICSPQVSFFSTICKKRHIFLLQICRQKKTWDLGTRSPASSDLLSFLNLHSVAKSLEFYHPHFTLVLSYLQYPHSRVLCKFGQSYCNTLPRWFATLRFPLTSVFSKRSCACRFPPPLSWLPITPQVKNQVLTLTFESF